MRGGWWFYATTLLTMWTEPSKPSPAEYHRTEQQQQIRKYKTRFRWLWGILKWIWPTHSLAHTWIIHTYTQSHSQKINVERRNNTNVKMRQCQGHKICTNRLDKTFRIHFRLYVLAEEEEGGQRRETQNTRSWVAGLLCGAICWSTRKRKIQNIFGRTGGSRYILPELGMELFCWQWCILYRTQWEEEYQMTSIHRTVTIFVFNSYILQVQTQQIDAILT